MKEFMRKFTIILTAVFVVMGAVALRINAEDEPDGDVNEPTRDVVWNEWSECEWSIDDNGLLTIRPTNGVSGILAGWEGQYDAPWYDHGEEITSVKIESKVIATTCYGMFYNLRNVESIDVSGLDTSNVTDMSSMFSYCEKLTSLDVSNLDTGNVTDMNGMFGRMTSLQSLDLSNFDTRNVTDMMAMFVGDENLTALDLSNFDTGKVTVMHGMFQQCYNLVSVDVSNFDTSNVTDMGRMFQFCSSLVELDLSSFDTDKVTGADGMLLETESLIYFKVGNNFCQNADDLGEFYRDFYSSYDDSLKEKGTLIPNNINEPVAYTVRYSINYEGLDDVTYLYYKEASRSVSDGTGLTPPATRAETKAEKVFKGWDTDPAATTVVFAPGESVDFKKIADTYGESTTNFTSVSEITKTLYPVWGEKDPEPTPTPDPTPTPYVLPKTGVDRLVP